MKRITITLLFATLVAAAMLTACSSDSGSQTAEPSEKTAAQPDQQTVALKIGESIPVEAIGATIAFDTVLEDSRCPQDVECFWEGNAKVGLSLISDELREDFELNTSDHGGAVSFVRNGYAIAIENLNPKPKSTETIDPALYELMLKIQKQ